MKYYSYKYFIIDFETEKYGHFFRSWDRTKDFLASLRKNSGNNDVHFMKLDLASQQSVREFVQEFQDKYNR